MLAFAYLICYDRSKKPPEKGKPMLYTETKEEEMFDEMLDECYPVVKIGYMEFYPSQILKNCDPIAYQIGLSEYMDSLEEDEED
jgi:hypothetical protein